MIVESADIRYGTVWVKGQVRISGVYAGRSGFIPDGIVCPGGLEVVIGGVFEQGVCENIEESVARIAVGVDGGDQAQTWRDGVSCKIATFIVVEVPICDRNIT